MPRKTYRKKKRYTRSRTALSRSIPKMSNPTLLGDKRKIIMKYASIRSISGGSFGLPGVHVYSLNGMFDPDVTSTGAQPRGFDQIMALYDHYVVINAQVKVTFTRDGAATVCGNLGCAVRDSTTTSSTQIDYLETRDNLTTVIGQADSNNVRTINVSVNPNKFLGRPNPMSDPQLKGNIAANPSEQCYLHVWHAASANDATNPGSITIKVEIEYTSIFIEPKNPVQS